MDITCKREIDIKEEELSSEENYVNKDTWQQIQQDQNMWHHSQLSDTVPKDFHKNKELLKLKVDENFHECDGKLIKIKIEKEGMDEDNGFLDCPENDHLLDLEVEIDCQHAVKEESKEGEESTQISRTLRESVLPILLNEKNPEDKTTSIVNGDSNYKKDWTVLSAKNKPGVQAVQDDHKFPTVTDKIEDKEEMFRRLRKSTFPIVLLCKLNLEDEKLLRGREFEEGSFPKPTTAISQPLNIKSDELEKRNEGATTKNEEERDHKIRSAAFGIEKTKFKRKSYKLKKFKCNLCNFKTKYKGSLKFHMLKHSKRKLFSCPTCTHQTNSKNHLDVHILNHSNVRHLRCLECSYRTNSKGHLKIHLKIHSEKKENKFSLTSHTKVVSKKNSSIRSNIKDQKEFFGCSQCSFKTKQKYNLKIHLLNHSALKVLQCPGCDFRTNDPSNFRRHRLKHNPSPSKLFTCEECNFSTPRKDSLKAHILCKHSETRPFKCLGCDFATYRKDTLETHQRKYKFHCDVSVPGANSDISVSGANSKSILEFNSTANLGSKINSKCHSKPVPCKPFGTNSKSILEPNSTDNSRSKINSKCDSKPACNPFLTPLIKENNSMHYGCDQCSFETLYKSSLKGHIDRLHVNPKSFVCHICSHMTNQRADLFKHLLTHEEMTSLKCPHCIHVAKDTKALKVHLTTHTETKDAKCPNCEYATNRSGNLKRHIERHHS